MGKKRVKGEGGIYDEPKHQIGGVWLTLEAKDRLDKAAEALNISRSEVIERLARKGTKWLTASISQNP